MVVVWFSFASTCQVIDREDRLQYDHNVLSGTLNFQPTNQLFPYFYKEFLGKNLHTTSVVSRVVEFMLHFSTTEFKSGYRANVYTAVKNRQEWLILLLRSTMWQRLRALEDAINSVLLYACLK